MCAATGVTMTHGTQGDDRSAGAERVGGRARGRRDDDPVCGERGHVGLVNEDRQADQPVPGVLLDYHLVQRPLGFDGEALHSGEDRQALLDPRRAVEHALQDRDRLLGFDLG
jgi:hypothetical protein